MSWSPLHRMASSPPPRSAPLPELLPFTRRPRCDTPSLTSVRTCRISTPSTRARSRPRPSCATAISPVRPRPPPSTRFAPAPMVSSSRRKPSRTTGWVWGAWPPPCVWGAAGSQYRVIDFHVVGVVKEFPTAPKDSFLVANLPYVLTATHTSGPNVDLVSTSGNPHGTAAAIQQATAGGGATVGDITSQLATTSSSLTAISLAGISRLEEAFAVALALGAVVLFGTLAVIERRREFATMAAMGARLRTVASFLWTETTVVAGLATLLAAALGTVLSLMVVTILTHVFDPPPDALAVPWRFLGFLAVAIIAGALASSALTIVALRRADLSTALREA